MRCENLSIGGVSGIDIASGVLRNQEDDWVEEELYDGLKIVAVLSGQMRAQIRGKTEQLIRGPSVCAILSNGDDSGRQIVLPGEPIEYLMIRIKMDGLQPQLGIDADCLECVFGPSCSGRSLLLHRPATKPLQALCSQIDTCPFDGLARQMFIAGKALEVVAFALDSFRNGAPETPSARVSSDDHRRLLRARTILLERLSDPPGLPELAAEVGLNTRKLTEGFRTVFGTTIHGLLQESRLTEAYRLLGNGDISVSAAAYHVGYSPAHFSVAFRKRFGLSPREFLFGA